MMTMGNQLSTKGGPNNFIPVRGSIPHSTRAPPGYAHKLNSAKDLDEMLNLWTSSPAFGKSLDHAGPATQILQIISRSSPVGPVDRHDTPFFAYCVCQVVSWGIFCGKEVGANTIFTYVRA